jgi:hypothetical protein
LNRRPALFVLNALLMAFLRPASSAAAGIDADYTSLKQDPSLYCGEGVARLREHGGDPLEAERAALAAARGDLAESIETRISVLTTDVLIGGSKKAEERISSQSRSVSVVQLANVRTRTFTDRPHAGELTVLAYITRADYRRLLGGRLDDSPHGALTVMLGGQSYVNAVDLGQALGIGETAPNFLLPGFEVAFGPWSAGFSAFSYRLSGGAWDPKELVYSPGPSVWHGNLQFMRASAGYDWRLGKARLQPYVPLRLECQWLNISEYVSKTLPGGSAGVGMRYWLNNHAALDLRGIWHQGFQGPTASPDLADPKGSSFMIFPPRVLSLNLDGPELLIGLQVTD